MEIKKSCGGVVFRNINNKLEFLIVKSLSNGHWGFPKGHVEPGESEKDTALREIEEETGLEKVILYENLKMKDSYFLSDNSLKQVIFFIVKALSFDVNIQLDEIEEFMWCDFDKCINTLDFDNTKDVLKKAKNMIETELKL